jgi:hypothetical protein
VNDELYGNVVWWAMQLARDVDACSALLRGEPVDPSRLHTDWLEYAATFELVRLDFAAIDLLHRRAELRALLTEAA